MSIPSDEKSVGPELGNKRTSLESEAFVQWSDKIFELTRDTSLRYDLDRIEARAIKFGVRLKSEKNLDQLEKELRDTQRKFYRRLRLNYKIHRLSSKHARFNSRCDVLESRLWAEFDCRRQLRFDELGEDIAELSGEKYEERANRSLGDLQKEFTLAVNQKIHEGDVLHRTRRRQMCDYLVKYWTLTATREMVRQLVYILLAFLILTFCASLLLKQVQVLGAPAILLTFILWALKDRYINPRLRRKFENWRRRNLFTSLAMLMFFEKDVRVLEAGTDFRWKQTKIRPLEKAEAEFETVSAENLEQNRTL